MVILECMIIVDNLIHSISLKEGNSFGSIMADNDDSCVGGYMILCYSLGFPFKVLDYSFIKAKS